MYLGHTVRKLINFLCINIKRNPPQTAILCWCYLYFECKNRIWTGIKNKSTHFPFFHFSISMNFLQTSLRVKKWLQALWTLFCNNLFLLVVSDELQCFMVVVGNGFFFFFPRKVNKTEIFSENHKSTTSAENFLKISR